MFTLYMAIVLTVPLLQRRSCDVRVKDSSWERREPARLMLSGLHVAEQTGQLHEGNRELENS